MRVRILYKYKKIINNKYKKIINNKYKKIINNKSIYYLLLC